MNHKEQEARELVIRAGQLLLKQGLVARTWGNISARVSSTHFVITPSGRSYETLHPEDLVLVRIDDQAYEGTIKPSSEKGIHAAAYLHRPDAGVVIHTHQTYASCVSVDGQDLTDLNNELLGDFVPCAAYGLPGTKTLLRHVDAVMVRYPTSNAILLHRHGALCMARDFDRAFEILQALEDTSRTVFERTVTYSGIVAKDPENLLDSLRCAEPNKYFTIESHSAVLDITRHNRTLIPCLDDLAQIAGATIRCAAPNPDAILKALNRRNAVLVKGVGAICCAEDEDDLAAITAIIRKGCMAARYCTAHRAAPLSSLDRHLMRTVYTTKYSKRKSEA